MMPCLSEKLKKKEIMGGILLYFFYFRTELGLFGNIVAVKSIPGIPARHDNIDMILIRENTEGEYTNLEHEVKNFP